MDHLPFRTRLPVALLVLTLLLGGAALAGAQSQEPKPHLPGTPTAQPATPPAATPASGISGSTWVGPNWRVTVAWDPAVWSVEDELIERGYDGLQLGTSASTVFIEAYDGYAGDPDACLSDAQKQIGEREGVVDVTPLTGHSMPSDSGGSAALFGVTAKLADGTAYRGVEYVECRPLVPGKAVLEITWQVATVAFDAELPAGDTLLAGIALPGDAEPQAIPGAPVTPASL